MHAGDELELRFAEVGRDARMREGRAEPRRMRSHGERAFGPNPQTFLFDPAHRDEQSGRQRAKSRLEAAHRMPPTTPVAPIVCKPRCMDTAFSWRAYCISAACIAADADARPARATRLSLRLLWGHRWDSSPRPPGFVA